MTGTAIDLSAEAGGSLWQTLLVGAIIVFALAYLLYGFWSKQKRLRAGGGCGSCASCGSGGSCPIETPVHFPPQVQNTGAKKTGQRKQGKETLTPVEKIWH